jgi:hypothetical protein
MDVSVPPHNGAMTFIPYESDEEGDEKLVTGMMFVSDRCPGNLAGVYHPGGHFAAVAWCEANPDWYRRYCQ